MGRKWEHSTLQHLHAYCAAAATATPSGYATALMARVWVHYLLASDVLFLLQAWQTWAECLKGITFPAYLSNQLLPGPSLVQQVL